MLTADTQARNDESEAKAKADGLDAVRKDDRGVLRNPGLGSRRDDHG